MQDDVSGDNSRLIRLGLHSEKWMAREKSESTRAGITIRDPHVTTGSEGPQRSDSYLPHDKMEIYFI